MHELKPGERMDLMVQHHDPYRGWQDAYVEAYRTTRRGRRCVRFRVRAGDWTSPMNFSSARNAEAWACYKANVVHNWRWHP